MKKTHVNSNVDLNTLAGGAFADAEHEVTGRLLNLQECAVRYEVHRVRHERSLLCCDAGLDDCLLCDADLRVYQLSGLVWCESHRDGDLSLFGRLCVLVLDVLAHLDECLVDLFSEGRGGEPVFKLVAADGGLWKAEAVDNIKKYLEDALDGIENREQITIIA